MSDRKLPSRRRRNSSPWRVAGLAMLVLGCISTLTVAAAADYAVGSGNRGVTYLSRGRSGTVELRLSYYHNLNRWDFSPHQPGGARTETPVGRHVDPVEEAQCFVCHSTSVVMHNGAV